MPQSQESWGWAILGQARCNYFSCCSEGFISDIESGINWGSLRKRTVGYLWDNACKELSCQATRINSFLSKVFYPNHILRRLPFTLTLPQGDHSFKWNSPPHHKKELLSSNYTLLKCLNDRWVITMTY